MTQKQTASAALSASEKRSISGLAIIFALRMLGLFMILPVFSLSAQQYAHSTPLLIGLAIGAYGLTQAALQIPFGMMSDRIGRKNVIFIGLVLFALGSVLAAVADSIYTVILGRLLQGSGAIAAVVMALTADLTRDQHRTKAMAAIGISIGLSFSLALASGAALESSLGLDGIFWATAILAVVGMAVLKWWVPTPHRHKVHKEMKPAKKQLMDVLTNRPIMRMVISILLLHLLLTLSFFALPIALQDFAGIAKEDLAKTYLPILLLAFVTMVPFIIVAEKHRQMKIVFIGAIAVLAIAQFGWALKPGSLTLLLLCLWLFFTAFNILEASLPSMMSKLSPLYYKGTAMGVYSSAQFIGAFLGGVLGGVIYSFGDISWIFFTAMGLCLLWLLMMLPMAAPTHFSHRIIPLKGLTKANADDYQNQLESIPGVVETIIVIQDKLAYVKFLADDTDITELESVA
ncbi:MFS transporter [Methylophaga sp. OBS3]|uniref:MFS transporter n=1 Tax=Methylophaga sp. OBS3 TaxID=2991934 RepID=UPI0022567B90|nr:MFS transporter [Methylophaga sp. OBS3]MCX4189533.1 MFS transporter [Methylophaga sp. OBS3]